MDLLRETLLEYRDKTSHFGEVVHQVNKKMEAFETSLIPQACSTMTQLVHFAGRKGENVLM